jgi:hypothetical protein
LRVELIFTTVKGVLIAEALVVLSHANCSI